MKRFSIPGHPKSYTRRGWVAFQFPQILSEDVLKFNNQGEKALWEHTDPNIVELFLLEQDPKGYLWRLNWNGLENRTWIPSLDAMHVEMLIEVISRVLFPPDCAKIIRYTPEFYFVDSRKNTEEDLVF